MNVNIKIINPKAKVPTYGSEFSAGADLYALLDEKQDINPGKMYLVHTGIAMEIPTGYVGLVYARSGLATKKGLAPANKVGVIDSDYRGEIMVPIFNHSEEIQTIEPGERIAQIVLTPYLKAEFSVSDCLDNTDRGINGFGSTGVKQAL